MFNVEPITDGSEPEAPLPGVIIHHDAPEARQLSHPRARGVGQRKARTPNVVK